MPLDRRASARRTFERLLGDQRAAICPTWLYGQGFETWVDAVVPADAGAAVVLAALNEVGAISDNEVQAAVHPATERATAKRQGAVAVIPVKGPIFAKPNIFERYGLGISAETLGKMVTAAVDDPEVKAVVLDVDSPGGGVFGVPELAAKIMALRGKKPIIAHADHMAASAAYWIAAAADEIVASPSAMVGSVGVFILHMDFSEALKAEGVKPTFIATTPEKVDGNPYEPLSKSGEAELRALVDDAMKMFVGAVAKGRGVTPETVRADFGKGHVLTAGDALKAGMIDKVRTLEETLAAYGVSVQPQGQRPAASRGRAALALQRRSREIDLLNT